MTLRRFNVYVPDNTGGFSPEQAYLCSEVDALLKEARWIITAEAAYNLTWDEWKKRRDAFLKATETKP